MATFLSILFSHSLYPFRSLPSHIYRGVKPAPSRPKLDMWHLEPSLESLQEASLERREAVEAPTGRPTSGLSPWPPPWRGSFLEVPCCIATCLPCCNISLVLWWALQSMWWLRSDAWLDGVFTPWMKGYDFSLFSAKILHSQSYKDKWNSVIY